MKKTRKIILLLTSILLIFAQSGIVTLAENGSNSSAEEITRAEWLSNLVNTFEMTVEDDNYPDNYFSDLESTSEYYYDILVAVQFGVVNVEAGDPYC